MHHKPRQEQYINRRLSVWGWRPEELTALRIMAKSQGVSLSSLVRTACKALIDGETPVPIMLARFRLAAEQFERAGHEIAGMVEASRTPVLQEAPA